MSKSHYVMSLILCLNFSQFWGVSCGEKMGLLLASPSPCQCSYLPVCVISPLMCTVYAELVYTTKLHGYIKPQFLHLTWIGPCIVTYFYSKTNQMHQCIKFILFWNNTLHVSDGLSVHHQEFKTVHTATGICQSDTADCLLAS